MFAKAHKIEFFRQSGWMMIATTLGGFFMYAVHTPASRMPESEYGVFTTLLQMMNLMLIPSLGLQTVFAQQAAAACSPQQERRLAYVVRGALALVSLLWLIMVVVVFLCRAQVLTKYQIINPLSLWLTVAVGLAMLWAPILQGVMQGRQNFLWLGWAQVLNGCARFSGVLLLVGLLASDSSGAMLASLVGYGLAVGVAAWQSRMVWLAPGEPIVWGEWLGRVIPLTLGLGASQFMVAADQLLVQSIFDRNVTGIYGAAGTIGRALIVFTGPMMAVMFPKIVASAARSQRTNVLAQALGATALCGGAAALACTFFPELPLHIIYHNEKYWAIAPLVPWFAWSMLPLTMANVLVGNLLARGRFQAVPWLVLVAIGYGAALHFRAPAIKHAEQFEAFTMVVRTLGVFSLLLLSVAAWFTWHQPSQPAAPSAQGQNDREL